MDPADALALLMSPEGRVDPYPTYELLRAHGPVVQAGPVFFVVTGYAEADAILRDARFGVLDDALRDQFMPGWRESPAILSISRSMLRTNPPDHSRMRRLAAGAFTPRRIAAGQLGRVLQLRMAPDGSRAAVASLDGRVLLVARETGAVREVDRSEDGDATGLVFSPDSSWLAWSHPGPEPLRQLKLANTTDLTVSEATPLRFNDHSPAFTLDGKHLAFLSERSFDPVYDDHVFDLAFLDSSRPHLITLAATTPSPFGPQRHGRAFETPDKDETPDSEGAPATRIDLDGLADRIVPFPVDAGRYSGLRAAKDGVLWLSHPLRGVLGAAHAGSDSPRPRSVLERYDFAQRRIEELASPADGFAVPGDGKRVLLRVDGELRLVPSDRRAPHEDDGEHRVTVDLARVRQNIEPAAEWRQMYDEAGRLTRDHFWRPDLGGLDWDGVLERYRPVLERVATHSDLVDLLWEVQGELGTSHAYVSPARRNEGPPHYQRAQGLLGANLVRVGDQWVLRRILPGDSSDTKARSPLAGTGIREGAALTHVDGRPVDPVTGPYPLLAGAGGTTVELTFRAAEGGRSRRVAVVPLVDERPLRYQDWVARRRQVVRELSGGRCGYLHIPDLGGSGWAQFNRAVRMEVSRPSLIVDVRGNAGGHISELVIEKLTRTILGWDLTRDAQPVSYTSTAPRGPIVAVADEATSSDGDMITAAIKLLKLGPVVGSRTWGGVVGITGRHRLGDGTLITVPMNAAWFEAYGWGIENHGVEPDLEAVRTPLDWAEGHHAVLDDAVRLALELLEREPAKSPPDHSGVPDLARPPLPPRPQDG